MRTVVLFLSLLQSDDRTIEFKTSLEKKEEGWSFVIHGTTALPNGAILKGRVFYLDTEGAGDPIEGDLDFERPFELTHVKDGAFRFELYRFKRRPFSIPYRARVSYEPERQSPGIRAKVGDEEFSKDEDFRLGTPEEHVREVATAIEDLRQDFQEVEPLYRELRDRYLSVTALKPPDPKEWTAWKEPWLSRVDQLRLKNDGRLGIWAVWIERKGKLHLEGFTDRLADLARACTEALEQGGDAAQQAKLKMDSFLEYYADSKESMGFDSPDVTAIRPLLDEFEACVAPIREALKEGKAVKEIRPIRRKALQTLMHMLPHATLKGYGPIEDLTNRFHRLLATTSDGRSEEAKKSLLELEASLSAFKEFLTR